MGKTWVGIQCNVPTKHTCVWYVRTLSSRHSCFLSFISMIHTNIPQPVFFILHWIIKVCVISYGDLTNAMVLHGNKVENLTINSSWIFLVIITLWYYLLVCCCFSSRFLPWCIKIDSLCQGMRYIRSWATLSLLAITELPNNELTSIHTPSLPLLRLWLLMSNLLYFHVNNSRL